MFPLPDGVRLQKTSSIIYLWHSWPFFKSTAESTSVFVFLDPIWVCLTVSERANFLPSTINKIICGVNLIFVESRPLEKYFSSWWNFCPFEIWVEKAFVKLIESIAKLSSLPEDFTSFSCYCHVQCLSNFKLRFEENTLKGSSVWEQLKWLLTLSCLQLKIFVRAAIRILSWVIEGISHITCKLFSSNIFGSLRTKNVALA